jgi:hypothetical protein
MLIVFFGIQGIVIAEWVSCGQTVYQQCYLEVLTKLRERMRRKRPELWRSSWILHKDSASTYSTLSVKQFLVKHNITVLELLEHPPCSPDLASCNCYLFPKIKSVLKGTHLLLVEDVKAKTMEILNSPSESDLQNCSECWQHHMQKGTVLKDILVDFLNLLNKKKYRHGLICCV